MRFDFSHGERPDRPPPELTLTEPPRFSVEIQRGAHGWHLPSSPHGAEWLCLSPRPDNMGGNGDADEADAQAGEPAAKRLRGL